MIQRMDMVRTYCNIIGSRERDYMGNSLGMNMTREMTVFSGGAGLPYTEEVMRVSRDVFQLYGGKTEYDSGVFTSVMRSVAGLSFVCYGISQKQAVGRDSQFTQMFLIPREDVLDGAAYLQEVFGRNFVQEEAIHRTTRPTNEEVFSTTEHPRQEVKLLSEQRRKVLMHAAVLLCNGRKVLLVERDREYQKDYFRPLLRELFELIPAGHRYQIDVTTGRCPDDLDRLSSAQLIVTSQSLGGTLERPQLILEGDESSICFPNTRVWPSVALSQDGRNAFQPPAEKPDRTAETKEWTLQDNAQRDELSKHNEAATKTIQTDFAKLMECMDEEKSFWWKQPKWDKSISTFLQLRELHEGTYILGMESYNAEFCARLPALLSVQGGVEELVFDFMETKMSEEIRPKHLAYMRVRLKNFALKDEEFDALLKNYKNFDSVSKLIPQLAQQIDVLGMNSAGQVDSILKQVNALTNDFAECILPFRHAAASPIGEMQH